MSARRDGFSRGGARLGVALVAVVAVAAAVLLVRLSAQEDGGPPHDTFTIGRGIPATLYLPGEVADTDVQRLPDPPPPSERPPVIALAHGFGVDRALMSALARSLARAGYGVVAFDFRGHGENRHPFRGGELTADFDAVANWLARSPHVDAERLVVMGHSMGARAALEFAAKDSRPAAVVAVSGGQWVEGRHRPRNVLFLLAAADSDGVEQRVPRLAARLAGRARLVEDRTYGNLAAGTAVRLGEVGSREHTTVVWSGETVAETVAWLDGVFGIERDGRPGLADPRMGTVGLYLACVLVLLGALGRAVGRLAPFAPQSSPAGGGALVVLVAAVGGGAVIAGGGAPAGFLPLAGADAVLSALAVAGGVLLLFRRHRPSWLPAGWVAADTVPAAWRPAALTAVGAAGAIYVLMAPVGVVFHRLVPSPERLLAAVVVAGVLLPFTLSFNLLTRRGGPLRAALVAIAARVVLVVVLLGAIAVGILPDIADTYVTAVVVLAFVFEVFAIPAYAASRNVVAIAVTESLFLGWITGVTMPFG